MLVSHCTAVTTAHYIVFRISRILNVLITQIENMKGMGSSVL